MHGIFKYIADNLYEGMYSSEIAELERKFAEPQPVPIVTVTHGALPGCTADAVAQSGKYKTFEQPAPPSLSAEQWAIETATKLGYLSPIASDRSVMILKNALSAATKPINGTLGLDGDTQRDRASDGPALEKRVKELESAAPSGLSEFERSEIIRLASYSNNGDTVAEYVETLLGAAKPADDVQTRLDRIANNVERGIHESYRFEAEIRDRVLEEAAKTICCHCSSEMPLSDGKNGMHVGGLHCYGWAIRALKSQVSVTGASHDK